jgi:hypothetical protein
MTSLPYALLFCLFLCTAFLEHRVVRPKQILLIRSIVVAVALVFFGLRGHILTDFTNYYQFFRKLDASNLILESGIYEPGFVFLGFLAKQIHDNYFFWIFLSSAIHVFILVFAFKKYLGNVSLGLIFFLGYRGIFIEFNLMQNFMAILMFLLSITYLSQRKLVPYLVLNLIGMTFHISSIIYFPLYFVLHRNVHMHFGFLVIVGANIFYFVGTEFLIKIIVWSILSRYPTY